jgi:hypothetical protein
MTFDELITFIFAGETHPFAAQFAEWAIESVRFRAFAETYRTKIRKKIRGIKDEAGLRDLQFELEIAYLLLQERRFAVEYEKYGVGKQRSADFLVTFRANLPFNVEVKHIRFSEQEQRSAQQEFVKLANTVCQKIGQLAPGMINLLVLSYEHDRVDGFDGPTALLDLRRLAEQKDDLFFARRGLTDARDFLKQFQRLSAALFRIHQQDGAVESALWLNAGAKHRLPDDLRNALLRIVRGE